MKDENRFYVYVHRLKETGEIFYVGKGTNLRFRSQHNRNSKWKEITNKHEWYFEIHTEGLSESQSKSLEVELINKFNPIANFHKTDISAREVIFQDFVNLYYYSEDSPSGLRYLHGNKQSGKKKRCAHDVAGTLNPSGYYVVHCKGSNYFAHRVVWCLLNKCNIKEELIDHIDRNRSNNTITNLRAVTSSDNNKNSSLKSHNKTGYNGVSHLSNFNIYVCTWTDAAGVPYSKSFSALKYGDDLALALAADYRNRVATEKEGYLPNNDYIRPSILNEYSDSQIQEMFECDLISSNNSGISRIYFQTVRGNSFWNYSGKNGVRGFSCTKYGDERARELAIEYKNFIEKQIRFENLSEGLRSEIENPTRAGNLTGFSNLSFIGENKDKILVQVMIDYKNHTKRFDTKVLGLLPAISAALQWRDKMKNIINGDNRGT